MKFPWRKASEQPPPRDGTLFVHLRAIVHVGGRERPIDAEPCLGLYYRTGVDPQSGGYWCETRYKHSASNDDISRNGFWMKPEEYAIAVDPLPLWDAAPKTHPLAFVRPLEARYHTSLRESWPVYEAEIVWPHLDGWATAKGLGGACHPGYLDGQNVNALPFLWCEVDDFLPASVMRKYP